MKKRLFSAVGLLAAGLLATNIASASILPVFTSVSGSAPLFTYTYAATLDPAENLTTGSELCFADVLGLTGTPTAPTSWTATNSAASGCPINAGVTVPNAAPSVLYMYTGAQVLGTSNGGAPVALGNFTFQSTSGLATGTIAFGAIDSKPVSGVNQPAADQGEVVGPAASVVTPEPGTLLILGAGLVLVGAKRRVFRA